ncbi:hypothetical protein CDL12_08947 [Handroanthus impetiginosus]|uniref:Uncharacterized protein n=1 Tax=Handroanthus impetiginosus TaxID=429701 RepID=A0A2G9HM57_9LAMI|nr:hypothetical protein CDL12_08947 [Handroanthus impetiginosus]
MEKICAEKIWEVTNSAVVEEDEEEEALSLSDLPLIHNSRTEESCPNRDSETQDDFDFCSLSKEHEMCAADDVFFQGQILPLRNSVSSEKGLLLQYSGSRNSISRSISRSESMDHYHSGGFISSRSSSISSHQSSSSSGSTAAAAPRPKYKPKLNQFHSHPSPSPRIRFPTSRKTNHRNYTKKSSIWDVFRLGLVTAPPEISFQDLKTRCPSTNSTNSKNFGSRNSTSSNSSSISITTSNKTKKQRGFLGGCKCSANAVDTVPSRVVIIKRRASESDVELSLHQIEEENVAAKMTQKRATKKQLSHHRTFEWLKQLSLEGTAEEA